MTLRDEIAAIVYEAEDENLTTSMAADAIIALLRERLTSEEVIAVAGEGASSFWSVRDPVSDESYRGYARGALTAALNRVLGEGSGE